MSLIIHNTGMLVQTREDGALFTAGKEMAVLPVIENGWLLIEDGIIAGYGPAETMPGFSSAVAKLDAGEVICFRPSAILIPTWFTREAGRRNILTRYADCHTRRLPKGEVASLIRRNCCMRLQRMSSSGSRWRG